jgi:DNA-3-methyladenine glycosylase I
MDNQLYVDYHDKEWGKPVHDDDKHFEMLCLEGAQAGLSWETILKKRDQYRKVFSEFNPEKVARFTQAKINKLLQDPGIVRNKRKVESCVSNAKAFLKIQKEFGSFDKYIWAYVKGKPINNTIKTIKDYPTKTDVSEAISRDLKKRGFNFVGPTIIYAYMQAIGLVNDHSVDCYKSKIQTWYLYIVQTKDNTLYTGIALDVKTRFSEHEGQGKKCAKYLRGKAPLKLVFSKKVGSRSKALKIEHAIKQLSVSEKKSIIKTKKLPQVSLGA